MKDNRDLIEEKEDENKKNDILEDIDNEGCKLKIYFKFLNIIIPV